MIKPRDMTKRNQYKPINLSISAVQKRISEGRKKILLKQFEIDDESLREQLLIKNSPTSAMMKQIICYMSKKNMELNQSISDCSSGQKPRVNSVSYNKKVPTIYGKIMGNRPCARDGHSGIIIDKKMLIFGGNRQKIGFNNFFELNLEKLI